jgi:hypothetical protein
MRMVVSHSVASTRASARGRCHFFDERSVQATNYANGSSSKEDEALTLFPAFFGLNAPVMV